MYSKQKRNNSDLMKYAGLGAQIFVSLGIAVFAGYKGDKWLHFSFPFFGLDASTYCTLYDDL